MRIAVSNEVMRYSDKLTIDSGVDSKELMRRAGEGIYNSGIKLWGNKIAVVCGSGNNGGDGYVLALYLKNAGLCPTLVLLSDKFSDDGKYYYEKCGEQNIDFVVYDSSFDFSDFDSIADCIFGTGFRGIVSGITKECIEKINSSRKYVVSADINSGISGNGSFDGLCVKSDLTVAVGSYKAGHFLGIAKDSIKNLSCVDIGIEIVGEKYMVPGAGDFSDVLFERKHNSHKGTYGYVAIIGGCQNFSGAVKLANLAASAMRCGCGVVKLAAPCSLYNSIAPNLLESTFFPMDDVDGNMMFNAASLDLLTKSTKAVSCGMGWGQCGENAKILEYLLKSYKGVLIIDADGLNTLASLDTELIRNSSCEKVILTPHPLEFSRISGFSMDEIFADEVKCVKEYLSRVGDKAVVLLKGASTVICDAHETYIVDRGCPGMATAGSGDVLSGILTGLMGYSAPCARSVACGAYIAGVAGELVQKQYGSITMIASDTVKYIPEAVMMMQEKRK